MVQDIFHGLANDSLHGMVWVTHVWAYYSRTIGC